MPRIVKSLRAYAVARETVRFFCPKCGSSRDGHPNSFSGHRLTCPRMGCDGRLSRYRPQFHQLQKPQTITPNAEITRPNGKCNLGYVPKPIVFSTYEEYLASDLWNHLRRAIYQRDKGFCRICHKQGSQVHHLSYDTNVMEGRNLDQLVLLCRPCHKLIEFNGDGTKRSTEEAAEEFFHLITKPQPKHQPRQHKHHRRQRHSGRDPFAKTR